MTLPKGLYICYVQSFTTVDSGVLNVVVPNSSPSVLPYTKVRDNPHVTSEEWAWVRSHNTTTHHHQGQGGGPHTSRSPTVNYMDGEGEAGSEPPKAKHQQQASVAFSRKNDQIKAVIFDQFDFFRPL